MSDFWSGFIVGALPLAFFLVCFPQRFVIWSVSRGWVLKWEDQAYDFQAGADFARSQMQVEATQNERSE